MASNTDYSSDESEVDYYDTEYDDDETDWEPSQTKEMDCDCMCMQDKANVPKNNKNVNEEMDNESDDFEDDYDDDSEVDETLVSAFEVVDALAQIGEPADLASITAYLTANAGFQLTEEQIKNALQGGLTDGVLKLINDKYFLLEYFNPKPVEISSKRKSRRKTRDETPDEYSNE